MIEAHFPELKKYMSIIKEPLEYFRRIKINSFKNLLIPEFSYLI